MAGIGMGGAVSGPPQSPAFAALDLLLTVFGDPKAAQAHLQELRAAQNAADKSAATLAQLQGERQTELNRREAELDERNAKLVALAAELGEREEALASRVDDHAAAATELKAKADQLAKERTSFEAEREAFQRAKAAVEAALRRT
jgi:peptidoglycan hydrolase CwlO-like protein